MAIRKSCREKMVYPYTIFEQYHTESTKKLIENAYESCTIFDRCPDFVEQETIFAYYGIGNLEQHTLTEIAAILNISEKDCLIYLQYLHHKLYPNTFSYPQDLELAPYFDIRDTCFRYRRYV